VAAFELEPAALAVLAVACEALQRLRQAQEAIRADGLTVLDRFGQKKNHPALLTERDARSGFLTAIRQLGLDLEPIYPGPGRPGGS
jgi:P27 family predicted phage terminase small subunit